MNTQKSTFLLRSLRHHIAVGIAAIVVLVGGVGGWAATTVLSSAVIASGILVVEGNIKQVQHPTGGVIAELLVHDGDPVEAGDVLARLDATVTKANLSVVTKNLNQLLARQARLEAERDGAAEIAVPQELLSRVDAAEVDAILASERRLFEHRRIARDGQKSQLQEQIAQLGEQIRGYEAQETAIQEQLVLAETELHGVQSLLEQGLTSIDRVNSLARAAASLRGGRGQLIAAMAEARGKIAEIELELLQVDQALRSEVATELRDVQNQQGELVEREVAALDQLQRIDIRAPISGLVDQLAIHTVGGVISPAEVLMHIVPQEARLTVQAKIAAQDIDQLAIGQGATLRLVAFNRSTTPELFGTLKRISADLAIDERTGAGFYSVGIEIPQTEMTRLGELRLVPGMPVESFIRTGDRTVASYLLKPLHDHAERVFREN